jgi:hypothetical protein
MAYAGFSKVLLVSGSDPLPILLSGEISITEKSNTHLNVYGQLIEYKKQFDIIIKSYYTDKDIIDKLNLLRTEKLSIFITGFDHKLVFENVYISVLVDRNYPEKPHSLTIRAKSSNREDQYIINEKDLLLDLQSDSLQDGVVSFWKDESGLGNHFSQATEAQRPIKMSDGIVFDGIDDRLVLNRSNDTFNFTDGNGQDTPYTIILLAKTSSNKTLNAIFWAGISDNYFFWYDVDLLLMKNYAIAVNSFLEASIDYVENNNIRMISMIYDGSMALGSMKIFINDVEQSLNEGERDYTGMVGGVTNPIIGNYQSSGYFEGILTALKIYKRALTGQEILEQYTYLRGRYGL